MNSLTRLAKETGDCQDPITMIAIIIASPFITSTSSTSIDVTDTDLVNEEKQQTQVRPLGSFGCSLSPTMLIYLHLIATHSEGKVIQQPITTTTTTPVWDTLCNAITKLCCISPSFSIPEERSSLLHERYFHSQENCLLTPSAHYFCVFFFFFVRRHSHILVPFP